MKFHNLINEVKEADLGYKGASNRKISSDYKDSKNKKHGTKSAKKGLTPIDAEAHYKKISHNKEHASEILRKHKQVGGIRSRVSWYVKMAKKHGTTTEVCKAAYDKVKHLFKEGENNGFFFGSILPKAIEAEKSGKRIIEKKKFKNSTEKNIERIKRGSNKNKKALEKKKK